MGRARLDKPAFIGRHAVSRTNRVPLDKLLVGLEMASTVPRRSRARSSGYEGEFAGHITSSAWSPVLNKVVMLGWLYHFDTGQLPEEVTVDGRLARRVPVTVLRQGGQPVPALKRIAATRIVATPQALDAADIPQSSLALRFAPDELFVSPPLQDEVGHPGPRSHTPSSSARAALPGRGCPRRPPPSFWRTIAFGKCQTAVPPLPRVRSRASPPSSGWKTTRVLFIVPAPYAADFAVRMEEPSRKRPGLVMKASTRLPLARQGFPMIAGGFSPRRAYER
jgi:hypothetical protein